MGVLGRLSRVPLDLDPFEVGWMGGNEGGGGGFPSIKPLAGGRRRAIVRHTSGLGDHLEGI